MLFFFLFFFFFFSSRRRHTRSLRDWSSDVCSSDLVGGVPVIGSTPNPALPRSAVVPVDWADRAARGCRDRKSTRLNSSHVEISYAVFCLKKKKKKIKK